MLQLVEHARVAHLVFSSRPTLSDTDALVAVLVADQLLGFSRVFPPQFGGIPKLGPPLFDPQIHRMFGPTFDDHAVEAGVLQLRPPETAGLGLAKGPGQWRTSGHGVAGQPGDGCPGDDTGHEHELVLGAQRIGTRRQLLEQVIQRHGGAAHVPPIDELLGRFLGDRVASQVNSQYFSVVSAGHDLFSFWKMNQSTQCLGVCRT
jgi:hypothetical protein